MSNRRHRREPILSEPAVIERSTFLARVSKMLGLGAPSGPVCVGEVRSSAEADIMAGFLRAHGINAHILGDDAGRMNPVYQVAFGVRVLVPANQADEARHLLADANE